MAKDTKYFSHDYNARTDVKIKKMIQKKGIAAYGIFWAIVEDLYNNANALPIDYESIAIDLRTNEDLVESVINDFGLFVIEDGYFYSNSVAERLSIIAAISSKNSDNAKKRWEKEKTKYATAMPSQCDSNAIKKEIKEIKEIKENENKKIALPYKFSDIPNELKNNSQTKIFCIQTFKIKEHEYEKFIDYFIGLKTDNSDDEIVDLKEWNKHFKEWMKFNYDKLPQINEQRPKIKIL